MTQVPASSHGGGLPNPFVVTGTDANAKVVQVNGAAAQSAQYLTVLTNGGDELVAIDQDGELQAEYALTVGGGSTQDPSVTVLRLTAQTAQSADILRLVLKTDNSRPIKILSSGHFTIASHAAPLDAALAAGECALWFDQTNAAAKLMLKGKTADGTVVTAAVALA